MYSTIIMFICEFVNIIKYYENNVLRTAQNLGGGLTPLKIIFQKFGGLASPKLANGKPHDCHLTNLEYLAAAQFPIPHS